MNCIFPIRQISFPLLSSAIFLLSTIENSCFAQKSDYRVADNWFLQDFQSDNVLGLSVEKAYKKLLKKKKGQTVVVAVIDSGIDTNHEDLIDVLWINDDEIVGNGLDDDNNGYIDDIHGWNFIGGPSGNVHYETFEYIRILKALAPRFEMGALDSNEVALYREVKQRYLTELSGHEDNIQYLKSFSRAYDQYAEQLKQALKTDKLTYKAISKVDESDSVLFRAKKFMGLVHVFYDDISTNVFDIDLAEAEKQRTYYDLNTNYRAVVNDSVEHYGNNDLHGPDPDHGTHVAGIIGASRNNKIGIKGIANNVKIMAIRAVPEGDERDMDVANAIRYAVDNGAKVINMSFGKPYSPQKHLVDSAALYALEKGVLLIHGAGNEAINIDSASNYPSRYTLSGEELSNWIEVGASFAFPDTTLSSDFSNYGKENVDVFAPGVHIYSTTPGNHYEHYDGTSMAAPMVSGLAALIRSYYPDFTVKEVKQIILESVTTLSDTDVLLPGLDKTVKFSELSRTGGVVNAYNALLMAEELKMSKEQDILQN